jgi:putative transcriptional regulator
MHESVQGRLLIASPMLNDPNFFRSVIYIARHDEEGALGVVLNRPSDMQFEDLIEEARGKRPRRSDVIYYGGPVEGPLLALHMMDNVGDLCADKIWLTSDDDHLLLLGDRPEIPARFFTGYSGWGEQQLEAELAAGGWMVAEPELDHLWADSGEIWEQAVKQQGHNVLRAVLPAAGCVDPQVN